MFSGRCMHIASNKVNYWSVSIQASFTAAVRTVCTKKSLTSDKIQCLLPKERAALVYSVEQSKEAVAALTKAIKINKSDSTIQK